MQLEVARIYPPQTLENYPRDVFNQEYKYRSNQIKLEPELRDKLVVRDFGGEGLYGSWAAVAVYVNKEWVQDFAFIADVEDSVEQSFTVPIAIPSKVSVPVTTKAPPATTVSEPTEKAEAQMCSVQSDFEQNKESWTVNDDSTQFQHDTSGCADGSSGCIQAKDMSQGTI